MKYYGGSNESEFMTVIETKTGDYLQMVIMTIGILFVPTIRVISNGNEQCLALVI